VIATAPRSSRAHSNARALDVFEANDIWALEVPYVIAVGLTAEEWPQPSQSPLPPEFQEAVLRARGATGDARAAAGVGRRPRPRSVRGHAPGGGSVRRRHPTYPERPAATTWPAPLLLDHLDTRRVSEDARRRLIGTDRELPPELRAVVGDGPERGDGESEGNRG